MSVQRVAAIGSAVVVVASVIAGLFVTGSPLEQRLLGLDERRVSDLCADFTHAAASCFTQS